MRLSVADKKSLELGMHLAGFLKLLISVQDFRQYFVCLCLHPLGNIYNIVISYSYITSMSRIFLIVSWCVGISKGFAIITTITTMHSGW